MFRIGHRARCGSGRCHGSGSGRRHGFPVAREQDQRGDGPRRERSGGGPERRRAAGDRTGRFEPRPLPEMVTEDDADLLPRLTAVRGDWRAYAAGYEVVAELDAIISGLLIRGTRTASGGPAG